MGEQRDVIDILTDDHRLIDNLLERLDREERPAEMRALFLRVAHELAAHEAAERDVLFPAFRKAFPAGGPEVLALTAEHGEADSLLVEMLRLDPGGLGFAKRASALVVELRGHFAVEEEVLFARLRSTLDPVELAALGNRVRAVKRVAPVFPAA